VTLARAFTNTFAGIQPTDAPLLRVYLKGFPQGD
jgi:hypothetical protein